MATTFSSLDLKLAADGLIAIPALVKRVDEFAAFSTQLKNSSALEGDTIQVPVYGLTAGAAAFDKTTNNYLTAGTDSATGVGVVLGAPIKQTSLIPARYLPNLDLRAKMQDLANAVLQKCQLNVYDSITAATYGAAAFTGIASTFDMTDIIDLETSANDFNFGSDRVLVVSDAYLANVKKSDVLIALRNVSGGNGLDTFAEAAGFKLIGSNLIKSAAPALSADNLVGFMTDKSCIAIAAAYPNVDGIGDPGVMIERTIINGFPIQFRSFYDRSTDQLSLTAECMFGFNKLRTGALKRLISA